MISDVSIVCWEAHQIVNQTEDDQECCQCGQDEHNFGILDTIFAEGFYFVFVANFHFFDFCVGREHEVELCQVNAAQRPLNTRAHIPEHRVNECYNYEEAQNQRPNEIQQICQSHQHCTGNSSTHSRPPRSIHLVASCTSCQKANKQNHKSESSHSSGNYREYHLHGFNPYQSNVKDLVHHDYCEWSATIHGPTEYSHPQ